MKPVWRQTLASGSQGECSEGVLATKENLLGHPPGSFSASTTAILGAANSDEMAGLRRSTVTWRVRIEFDPKETWLRGFLVATCLRHYGGCHSRTKDQEVLIFVNRQPFERFRLASIPHLHDDYFFRPPAPEIPLERPLTDCQTFYAWPIQQERLVAEQQEISVTIQQFVRWDIDYVGFVYQVVPAPDFDVALSFAGEDRAYVEQVADLLKGSGVKVFYDFHFKAALWGQDLYEHLSDLYRERARFTVMFVSRHYKDKLWANHERRSAQARAFTESRGYILPARFDDTEIPGLLPTTAYIDLTVHTPEELVALVIQKLSQN